MLRISIKNALLAATAMNIELSLCKNNNSV